MAKWEIINCVNCRYWVALQPTAEKKGECHYFPPTPLGAGNPRGDKVSEFRTTRETDWCGQAVQK